MRRASEAAKTPMLSPAPPSGICGTFLLESRFLRDLVAELTPDVDEQMQFLTGPTLGCLRVVCRRASPVTLDGQSPVWVQASAQAVADVLIPVVDDGADLHMIAHSHPGRGPGATCPSGTDVTCLGRLQRSGSEAIGCIVTRDRCVRFFTVFKPFRAVIVGSGVTALDLDAYRLDRPS